MGQGTQMQISSLDGRAASRDRKLVLHTNEHEDMNDWNLPAEVANGTTESFYIEFQNWEDGYGTGAGTIKVADGYEVYFRFAVAQDHYGITGYDYQTVAQLGGRYGQYVLTVLKNNEVVAVCREGETKEIKDCPPHWDSDMRPPEGYLRLHLQWVGDTRVPVSRMSWLTAHNAFTSPGDGWIIYQQSSTIAGQLEGGVRSFMLDTWEKDGQVVLAHGGTSFAHGLQKIGFYRPLASVLESFRAFLQEHPGESISIFLENSAPDGLLWEAFQPFLPFVYGKMVEGRLTYPDLRMEGPGDTVARMPDLHGKMVLFIDSGSSWIPRVWDYCIETTYGDSSLDPNLAKAMRQRPESGATNQNVQSFPFLIVNHFPDFNWQVAARDASFVAMGVLAAVPLFGPLLAGVAAVAAVTFTILHAERLSSVNSGERLKQKVDWALQPPTAENGGVDSGHYGRQPNFFALDFVLSGTAIDAVNYASSQAIDEYLERQSRLFPAEFPLAVFGMKGRAGLVAYRVDAMHRRHVLPIAGENVVLRLPESDQEEFVYLDCDPGYTVNAVRMTPRKVGDVLVWDVVFNMRVVPVSDYLPRGAGAAGAYAVPVAGGAEIPLDINVLNQIEVVLRRDASTEFAIYLRVAGAPPVLCATCRGDLSNFVLAAAVRGAPAADEERAHYAVSPDHPLLEEARRRGVPAPEPDAAAAPGVRIPFPSAEMAYDLSTAELRPRIHRLTLLDGAGRPVSELPFDLVSFTLDPAGLDGGYRVRAVTPGQNVVDVAGLRVANGQLVELRFLAAAV